MNSTNEQAALCVGKNVVTFGFDDGGHFIKTHQVVTLSDQEIVLRFLSTTRKSGVTEERGELEKHGRDVIEHLLIPPQKRAEKHLADTKWLCESLQDKSTNP